MISFSEFSKNIAPQLNHVPLFYDCEFQVSDHGRKIDPISIAIVPQDSNGNKLYLINRDFDWNNASEWLLQNVKPSIDKIISSGNLNHLPSKFTSKTYLDYVSFDKWKKYLDYYLKDFISDNKHIQMWGYYSAFDHVVLASIYGNMIDIPSYLEMYTNDLKQVLVMCNLNKDNLLKDYDNQHDCLIDACWNRDLYNILSSYIFGGNLNGKDA